jgi:transposase
MDAGRLKVTCWVGRDWAVPPLLSVISEPITGIYSLDCPGKRGDPVSMQAMAWVRTSQIVLTRSLQKNGRDEEAEGKSRGGLSTKIHAAVDGPGYPLRFLLTGGQASEYGQSECLIAGFLAEYVLADKGYDSNAFIQLIESQGSQAVIPPHRNRKEQRDYNKEVYKAAAAHRRIQMASITV